MYLSTNPDLRQESNITWPKNIPIRRVPFHHPRKVYTILIGASFPADSGHNRRLFLGHGISLIKIGHT